MREIFWLDDDAWALIETQLPKNKPGPRRVDDRRIISEIIHVLKSGCRWKVRWSLGTGQFGGKNKLGSGVVHAANF